MVRGPKELSKQRTISGYVASSKLDKAKVVHHHMRQFVMKADALSCPETFQRMLTSPQGGRIYHCNQAAAVDLS